MVAAAAFPIWTWTLNGVVEVAAPEDRPAIERFNRRLQEARVPYALPISSGLRSEAKHRPDGFPVYRELVVFRDEGEIRAGILQLHSRIDVLGSRRHFCWSQLPVSEGLVDPRFGMAMVKIVKTVEQWQPFQMCLGVGSLEEPWARMMLGLGWKSGAVPFLFLPVNSHRVATGLRYLKQRPRLRKTLAALSGLGGGRVADLYLSWRRKDRPTGVEVLQEARFDSWADEVYASSASEYGAAVVRDSPALGLLYPPDDERFTRLRIRKDGRELGWLVVIDKQMENDRIFGDLHVGTLVDGLGRPADCQMLLRKGVNELVSRGVDLIVANWSHRAWEGASRNLGFLPGPTNFYFFVSKGGTPLLGPECPLDAVHLSRGDNDGPGKLLPKKA